MTARQLRSRTHQVLVLLAFVFFIAAPAGAQDPVSSWGYNGNGGLGDGSLLDRSLPVTAPGVPDVIALAGGYDFSVAVRSNGTVWTWGAGSSGALGNGTTMDAPDPVTVSGLSGVVRVAAGLGHVLALKSNGSVWAWGANDFGQLGDGSGLDRLTPVIVSGLPADVVTIACGRTFSFALTAGGDLWAWGNNANGQLGDGTTVAQDTPILIAGAPALVAIDGGEYFGRGHAVALAADGSVWTWGANDSGQLGDGTIVDRHTPAAVPGLDPAVAVAAGLGFNLAVLADGTVAAWGSNTYGQLGNGTNADAHSPVLVKSENGLGILGGITAVSAGVHSLALRADGTLRAWGYNYYGELGDGTTDYRNLPVASECMTGVARIAAADYHSLATGTNACAAVSERLSCWGYGGNGGLGDNTLLDQSRPVHAQDLTNVQYIAGGADFSVAVRSDGTVWTWGLNTYGQIGNGTTTDAPIPVEVTGPTGVVKVAAGFSHTLALESDGTVWAWGANDVGQLGDGTGLDQLSPVVVSGLPADVVTIACGRSFSFALTAGGDLWGWGRNSVGQLGDGTTTDQLSPIFIASPPPLLDIEGGEWFGRGHTVALAFDGSVWTWGANDVGQLGDGTLDDRLTPAAISGLGPAVDIAAGLDFGLALLADGTVAAWGGNFYGQLGDGTNVDALSPVSVKSENGLGILGGITAVSAGVHSLALHADGRIRAWGYNFYGQLGDGTMDDRNLPVVIDCLTDVVRIAAADYHSMALGVNNCAPVSGVAELPARPKGVRLNAARWIPSSGADLDFELDRAAEAVLEIFTVQGQRLAGIADDRYEAGRHRVHWDGRTAEGGRPATGIYFVRLIADGEKDSRRLIIRR